MTYRFKAVTTPGWRTIDCKDEIYPRGFSSGPLLIITPIFHPAMLKDSFLPEADATVELPEVDFASQKARILPSLSVVLPISDSITNSMLGHSQFHR